VENHRGQEEKEAGKVQKQEGWRTFLEGPSPLWKDEEEMKKQRGKGQQRGFVQPEEERVEPIHLPRRGEDIQGEERKTDQIEGEVWDGEGAA